MSTDPAITTLIISATYVAVVGFGSATGIITSSPYNPAAAFGLFFGILFDGAVKSNVGIYVFLFFSYLGAVLAILLFEFVYKKAMHIVAHGDGGQGDSDEDRPEHDALMPMEEH